MFIVSLKASKKKIWAAVAIVVILVAGCFLVLNKGGDDTTATCAIGEYNLVVTDNASRIDFLAQFGWETSPEPVEITEVMIPVDFNDTYREYNNIQIAQGLDLSKYAGKTCKRWTYEITNYPGAEKTVRANLLILNDRVIGGDICSVQMDGFLHGFVYEKGMLEQPSSQPATESSGLPSSSEVQSVPEETSSVAVESSTERETLAPDPEMPEAPVD